MRLLIFGEAFIPLSAFLLLLVKFYGVFRELFVSVFSGDLHCGDFDECLGAEYLMLPEFWQYLIIGRKGNWILLIIPNVGLVICRSDCYPDLNVAH
jgi:hypothetical protein